MPDTGVTVACASFPPHTLTAGTPYIFASWSLTPIPAALGAPDRSGRVTLRPSWRGGFPGDETALWDEQGLGNITTLD